MARTGENIYRRKDGRWEGRYIASYGPDGKAKHRSVYAGTYAEVKKKVREAAVSQPFPAGRKKKADQSFGDAAAYWLDSTRLRVKESTYVRYRNLISTHILPRLGSYPIGRIDHEMMESYAAALLACGRLDRQGGLSPKTVRDIMTVIKSVFAYAEVSGSCDFDRIRIKGDEKDMRVLTRQEQKRLKDFLLAGTDPPKFGVLLSLYTGIRIGELCALRWEDLDIAAGTLRVRSTMQRIQAADAGGRKTKVTTTSPKSRCSIRKIPVPGFLLPLAESFRVDPEAFVLTGERDTFAEPRTMQNRFKSYMRQAGIADANFHALRHTFSTRCVELGFELKSLSEILGHADVKITLGRYVHPSFDLKRENMQKLAAAGF
ncbi:MAG: site-specific integrase [Clostridium sp.]|nr:site-specific integrase [Clostridium sp.]